MSENILQVFEANPITSNTSTDLMYFGQSPYGVNNDAAMTYANFAAQFGVPYTAAALTEVNDTNVTLTLGGTPATSLLHAVSITAGWTGTLSPTRGGTGVNNGTNTITLAGAMTTVGAFGFTFTFTGATGVTFPTSGTLATTSQLPTPAALTESNDTNVTLTLGGTPSTALLQAVSITAGWSGLLGLARGGTNANLSATGGTSQVLRQSSNGAAVTVSQLAAADLSNNTTGTGEVVLQTSPTLITPTLGVAKATSIQFPQDGQLIDPNGNVYVTFQEVTGAINNVEIGNSATGNAPFVSAVGVDTNVTLALNGQGTGGAAIKGTGTNDNAATGYVGEYQIASVPFGSATSLTNNTAKTIVTLPLTAGDWDVSGVFGINPAASTITQLMACGVSLTTNTFASFPDPSFNELAGVATTAGASVNIITGVTRISLPATTNVFLIGFADFTVSTNTGFGLIQARRVR